MAIANIDELDKLNTGRVKLNQAIDQANTVQGQLDTIVIASGTSDAETIQARGGEPLLYNRLDKVDAQLADIALQFPYPTGGDDTSLLQTTINLAKALGKGVYSAPDLVYKIDNQVDFRYVRYIDFKASILVNFIGIGVLIGNFSTQINSDNIYFRSIKNVAGTIPVNPLARIVGLKNAKIEIDICDYLQLYADASDPTMTSIAYCQFRLNYIKKLEINTSVTALSWINENTFWGGRFVELIIDGSYRHNNNTFYRPTFESSNININKGDSNKFQDCRFEGVCSVTFGMGTHSNIITQQWLSQTRNAIEQISATITDNGKGNVYQKEQLNYYERFKILEINNKYKIFNDLSNLGITKIGSGLNKLKSIGGNQAIFRTGLIPVTKGMLMDFDSDVAMWRPRFYVYDVNKQPITVDNGSLEITGYTFVASGYYGFGADTKTMGGMAIVGDDIKYIELYLLSGSTASNVWFNYFIFNMYVKKNKLYNLKSNLKMLEDSPILLTASPTSGFARLGQLISKSVGGIWTCTKSIETTTSGVAITGATSITVTLATGIANGDVVGILLDDNTTHWTSVSGLSGTTFTITTLPSQVSSGNRIVFNAWV